jgi:uncharacterized protein YeaO (DUF488 family)
VGPLLTKRIYEPAAPADGTRVLVMRLWPRGIRKERVQLWLRDLGPSVPLLRAFRAGAVPWPEYRRRYLAELEGGAAQEALAALRARLGDGPVTLLCGCPDERHCHRTLLRDYLDRRLL